MPRNVKCGLIQASNACSIDEPIEKIKHENIVKNVAFIEEAATRGVQIICMQEVFTTPYFCAEMVFNPSATVAGLSEYLWELEQPAHAVANGYFVGATNRVRPEKKSDTA